MFSKFFSSTKNVKSIAQLATESFYAGMTGMVNFIVRNPVATTGLLLTALVQLSSATQWDPCPGIPDDSFGRFDPLDPFDPSRCCPERWGWKWMAPEFSCEEPDVGFSCCNLNSNA